MRIWGVAGAREHRNGDTCISILMVLLFNANNDVSLSFLLSQKLTLSLVKAGLSPEAPIPSLEEVTDKFEELYQGKDGKPGLKDLETLIPAKGEG